MCGIVGVAGRRSSTLELLRDQCAIMRHRGPDGAGEWQSLDGRVALGHQRLAIIDLSLGANQPMTSSDGRLHVILNGEIYNYKELRATLIDRGHRFRTRSDTEVLLEAYAEWGDMCLDRLNGMFAFALYDGSARRIVIGRDRAGEKPLFYAHAGGRLAFASELKALMADRSMPRRLNPEALDHYLAYGFVPGELCLLADVQKLAPAHALAYDVDSDALRVWRYWTPPAPSSSPAADAGQLVDELDGLLADAVRLQLVADVPVGILLSGGVDSSLVTAMASRATTNAVRTFTITFPGHATYDETAYAQIVASHFGTRHTTLIAEPATVDLLPELARQYDEPIGDSSMVPTFLVSRLVRQNCTVALGGDGGDELFGGYMHYSRVQRQLRARRLVPGVFKRGAGSAASILPIGFRGRTYLRSLAAPDAESWVHATLHLDCATRRRLAPATRHLRGLSPESYRLNAGAAGDSVLQKMTRADFQTYLPDDILVKVDRASMLASLEVRAPFLDYRIIEFAFGKVPDSLRATGAARKVLLKMLAKRLLPDALDVNRKQGFSLPLDAWFNGHWGRFIGDVLTSAPPELYEPRVIREMLRSQARGLPNAQRLFNLAILELWRREYGVEVPAS